MRACLLPPPRPRRPRPPRQPVDLLPAILPLPRPLRLPIRPRRPPPAWPLLPQPSPPRRDMSRFANGWPKTGASMRSVRPPQWLRRIPAWRRLSSRPWLTPLPAAATAMFPAAGLRGAAPLPCQPWQRRHPWFRRQLPSPRRQPLLRRPLLRQHGPLRPLRLAGLPPRPLCRHRVAPTRSTVPPVPPATSPPSRFLSTIPRPHPPPCAQPVTRRRSRSPPTIHNRSTNSHFPRGTPRQNW